MREMRDMIKIRKTHILLDIGHLATDLAESGEEAKEGIEEYLRCYELLPNDEKEVIIHIALQTAIFRGNIGVKASDLRNFFDYADDFDTVAEKFNSAPYPKFPPSGKNFASIFVSLKAIVGDVNPLAKLKDELKNNLDEFVKKFRAECDKNGFVRSWYFGAFFKVLYYLRFDFDTFSVPLPGGKVVEDVWKEIFGFEYHEKISVDIQRHLARVANTTPIDINSGIYWVGQSG
ncbi:hypothetical protein DRN76_02085 [Methanosarcinales archaeon]|nr:MAG: hypothetical protein DRN76_02085 [Methanosarcinales archaeon]